MLSSVGNRHTFRVSYNILKGVKPLEKTYYLKSGVLKKCNVNHSSLVKTKMCKLIPRFLSGVRKPKEKPKNFRNVLVLIPVPFSSDDFREELTAPPAHPLTPRRITASPPEANWLLGSDLGERVLCTAYGWLPVLSFIVGVVCHCGFYFSGPKRGAAYLLKGQADIW